MTVLVIVLLGLHVWRAFVDFARGYEPPHSGIGRAGYRTISLVFIALHTLAIWSLVR